LLGRQLAMSTPCTVRPQAEGGALKESEASPAPFALITAPSVGLAMPSMSPPHGLPGLVKVPAAPNSTATPEFAVQPVKRSVVGPGQVPIFVSTGPPGPDSAV
jgi:hypothetical protein